MSAFGGDPLPTPSQVAPNAGPAAPPSSAKKGKKREAPAAEPPLAPLARDSSAAAPKSKKPPLPRPVRKTARSGAAAPPAFVAAASPREPSPFTPGAGFVVLQECLHTHPDAVPVVGHGQFPPSAPYYIVRIRVCISSRSIASRLLIWFSATVAR